MDLLYNNPILATAAMIPAVFLMIKIYQADRIEKEPISLLVSLVMMGILATLIAGIVEMLGYGILTVFLYEDSLLYCLLFYFGVVAVAEEGAKFLLLKKISWNARHFDYQFDGIVYAVFVSLGFALWENIGYVGSYGLGVALLRAVTAVPGHACFGVFMGAWYGLAKRYSLQGNRKKEEFYLKLALGMPILIHGAYDFLATVEFVVIGSLGFYGFLVLMFVTAFQFVKKLSARDKELQPDWEHEYME